MSEVLLKAENVSIVFGGLKAVSDFDFYINKGELIGLIGPNGAGKTTAFNLITGVYQPTTGSIEFASLLFVNYPVCCEILSCQSLVGAPLWPFYPVAYFIEG